MKKLVVIEATRGCIVDLGDGREVISPGQLFVLVDRKPYEKATEMLAPDTLRELTKEQIEALGDAIDPIPRRPTLPEPEIPRKRPEKPAPDEDGG